MKIRQSKHREKKGIKLIDPRINKDKRRKDKKEISPKLTKIHL